MDVHRLKGNTRFGSYVVSIFIAENRIDRIESNGKPNRSVKELCDYLSKTRTKLVNETVMAIKLSMIKNNEYRGEVCTSPGLH